jgi:Family of unknown function (DUF6427)
VVSFFKDKSPSAVLGLVIVSIGTRAFFWKTAPLIITHRDDGLIYFLLSQLTVLPAAAIGIFYHLIVVVQALRLNYALNDARMFPRSALTTALAYVLLTALMPQWNNISAALVINSMIIWLLYRFMRLYNTHHPKTVLYNIGLITATTVLLYYPALPLLLIVFFALASARPFSVNEWIVLLIGIITPFYFVAGYLFLTDQLHLIVDELKMVEPRIIKPLNLPVAILTLSMAAIGIIPGIFLWQSNSGRITIQGRKIWGILFVMLILLLPVVYFFNNSWPDALLLAIVPAAAFMSNTFLYPKKNIGPALLFWLFVALIIYNNWFVTKI